VQRHDQAEARRHLVTMHAVHAAAAPLISEKGGRIYDKFKEAMMKIIRPLQQLTFFDHFKKIAEAQEAARRHDQDAA
jgi:tellurite resistance protein